MNPVSPGDYFYQMWKDLPTPSTPVYDVHLDNVHYSIANTSYVPPLMVVTAKGEMNYSGHLANIHYHLGVHYYGAYPNGTGPDVTVALVLKRTGSPEEILRVGVLSITAGDTEYADVTWNETTTAATGLWTIGFLVTAVGTAGGEVYSSNTTCLETNSTHEVALTDKIGDLGGGSPVPTFYAFDEACNSQDIPLFLRGYRGTAGTGAPLCDLGSGSPVPQFWIYDGLCNSQDIPLFLRCYRGTGP